MTFCGIEIYDLLWYFLIYSFLGWVVEVVYHGVVQGKIVNRGFLNGPLCPVYGFGVVGILIVLHAVDPVDPVKMNTIVVFVMGALVCTLIELIAGWLLETLFHARWWDYRKQPLNFKGYICISFSLAWGLAVVLVIKAIHPGIEDVVKLVPTMIGWILLAVIFIALFADSIVTAMIVAGLNKKIKELDNIKASMRIISDNLSDRLGGGSLKAVQAAQMGQVKASLAKDELQEKASQAKDELQEKASLAKEELQGKMLQTREQLSLRKEQLSKELMAKRTLKRVLDAFPQYETSTAKETLADLKGKVSEYWNERKKKS